MKYERDATYSGHIQDLGWLIEKASETGASALIVHHKDGTNIEVRWYADGEMIEVVES